MSFEIVADVTSEVDKALRERENIHLVPMYIVRDVEKIKVTEDFSYESFYKDDQLVREWLSGKLKTSQPSIKDVIDTIEQYYDKGSEILAITLSSKLSGTYNVFKNASRILSKRGYKLTVLDSLNASYGIRLLIEDIISLRNEGKSVEEVIEEIDLSKYKAFIAPTNIEFLLNSGRLNKIKYAFLKLTRQVPLLQLKNGELTLYKLTRDYMKGLNEIVKGKKGIFATSNPRDIEKHKPISPIISTNTGPGYAVIFRE